MMLRKYFCHQNVLSKSSSRKSFIKRLHLILSHFFKLSFVVVILILLFLNNKVEGSLSTSKSQLKHERNGRCKYQSFYDYIKDRSTLVERSYYQEIFSNILVIFNWIKFQNDVCHAKNYNTEHHEYDEDGVCYTSEECSSRGGLHKANCAAGYGACCVCRSNFVSLS